MDTFFVKLCSKNSSHYVVSFKKDFPGLANRKCPFCRSDFNNDILEVQNDGKPRIGFDNKEAIDQLFKDGIYFAKIDVIFNEF